MKRCLVIAGVFVADPSLWDKFVWLLEVVGVMIGCPVVDGKYSLYVACQNRLKNEDGSKTSIAKCQ